MKPIFITFVLAIVLNSCYAQYYLRGELKDEQGRGLQGARIWLSSKGSFPYYTGASGAFGIPVNVKVDTATFTLEGYEILKTIVSTGDIGSFILKVKGKKANTTHLFSLTKNLASTGSDFSNNDGETYSSTIENQFVSTDAYPETGFALHVDRASYSNIRRFLTSKEMPPTDAVRIEEMLNYFNFCIKKENRNPTQGTFSVSSTITSCPWHAQNQLLFINVQAAKIKLNNTPPANLVFLIDVSGSMDRPNRLPLLKNAFKLLVENLRSIDRVSIVTYGDRVTVLLEPTTGDRKQKMIESIEGLKSSGSTPGASAIRTAYNIARTNFLPNGNNRVIIATDGDFNVGQASEKELENIIVQESKSGIYLTCLGVGIGNYKDSKLETLAKSGNGNFAYIDNEREAEKVLVEEFAQTLFTVANNVYLNVKFDSALVKEYRLLGFDNKKSALADKNAELEGGEVGSGHSLLAAFEITPSALPNTTKPEVVATTRLCYKLPGDSEEVKEEHKILNDYISFDKATSSVKFATAVIMFGTLLKQSAFSKDYTWDDLMSIASSAADPNNLLQMEFVDLVSKAKKIYPPTRKKKLLSLSFIK